MTNLADLHPEKEIPIIQGRLDLMHDSVPKLKQLADHMDFRYAAMCKDLRDSGLLMDTTDVISSIEDPFVSMDSVAADVSNPDSEALLADEIILTDMYGIQDLQLLDNPESIPDDTQEALQTQFACLWKKASHSISRLLALSEKLESTRTDNQAMHASTRNRIDETIQEISVLNADMQIRNDIISNLMGEIESLNSQLNALQQSEHQSRLKMESLGQKLSNQKRFTDELRNRLREQEEYLSKANHEHLNSQSQFDAMMANNEHNRREFFSTTMAEHSTLVSNIFDMERESLHLQETIAEMTKLETVTRKELELINHEVALSRAQLDQTRIQSTELDLLVERPDGQVLSTIIPHPSEVLQRLFLMQREQESRLTSAISQLVSENRKLTFGNKSMIELDIKRICNSLVALEIESKRIGLTKHVAEKELVGVKAENDRTETHIRQARNQLENAQFDITEMNRSCAAITAQSVEVSDGITRYESDYLENERVLADLRSTQQSMMNRREHRVRDAQNIATAIAVNVNEISNLNDVIYRLEAQAVEMGNQRREIENDLNCLNRRSVRLDEQSSKIRIEHASVTDKNRKVEKKIDTIDKVIARTRLEIRDTDRVLDRTRKEVDKFHGVEDRILILEKREVQLSNEIAIAQEQLAKVEIEHAETANISEVMRLDQGDLEDKIARLEEGVVNSEKQRMELGLRFNMLQFEGQDDDGQNSEINVEISRLKIACNSVYNRKISKIVEIEMLTQMINDAHRTSQEMQIELDRAREKISIGVAPTVAVERKLIHRIHDDTPTRSSTGDNVWVGVRLS